jgi:hypothetical protein
VLHAVPEHIPRRILGTRTIALLLKQEKEDGLKADVRPEKERFQNFSVKTFLLNFPTESEKLDFLRPHIRGLFIA